MSDNIFYTIGCLGLFACITLIAFGILDCRKKELDKIKNTYRFEYTFRLPSGNELTEIQSLLER